MTTSWTKQQKDFFDFIEESNEGIILTAVAGSGKTTTLVEGANYIGEGKNAAALAFNVRIKKDLEVRIGNKAQCLTLNGLGHRAMCKYIGANRPNIDKNKMYKIVREVVNEYDVPDLWAAINAMSGKAKSHGLVPINALGLFKSMMEDSYGSWSELGEHYDIDCSHEIIELSREVLNRSIKQSMQDKICDFDDQIYIPTCWGASFDQRDVLFVDEAQDLSAIQHKMLKKVLRRGGRMIAVGDKNQAIYGFRGSLSNSIDLLSETFGLKPMSLTVSFRCARRIVEEAQKVVPIIEPFDGAVEGLVYRQHEYDHTIFKHGDIILCRNNGPLIKMAYRLIMEGVGVHVLAATLVPGS